MTPFRNLLARFRARPRPLLPGSDPLGWVRGWIMLGLVWLILWGLGANWLYPWVAPFVRAPLPPPLVRADDAIEIPISGAPPTVPSYQTPGADANYGWQGPEAAKAARLSMAVPPPEFTYGAAEFRATAGRRVVLWPFARVMAGRDPPNIPQEIGDCVGWGWTHGCETSAGVGLYFTGGRFVRVFPPWIYGASRVLVGGGRIGGDGSTGAWAAGAVEKYGVLAWTDELHYSGSIARQWGSSGPPAKYVEAAKPFKAKVALVTSFDAACVALSHGWAVPTCSNQGWQKIVRVNGRVEGRPVGQWSHCTCFIGFDTRPGLEALYLINSWGSSAHAPEAVYAELDGAPPGGFWVDRATADRVLRAGDSYSVEFPGFTHTQEQVLGVFSKP